MYVPLCDLVAFSLCFGPLSVQRFPVVHWSSCLCALTIRLHSPTPRPSLPLLPGGPCETATFLSSFPLLPMCLALFPCFLPATRSKNVLVPASKGVNFSMMTVPPVRKCTFLRSEQAFSFMMHTATCTPMRRTQRCPGLVFWTTLSVLFLQGSEDPGGKKNHKGKRSESSSASGP